MKKRGRREENIKKQENGEERGGNKGERKGRNGGLREGEHKMKTFRKRKGKRRDEKLKGR
jgi:hypothetical protein